MNPAFAMISELPPGSGELAEIATSEGFGMVRRLIDDYVSDINRFSKPGECLSVALNGEHVIAVGGINVDPYYNSPRLGRIRHLYVHPEFRRGGVGRQLVGLIERHGEKHFDAFQLFTTSPAASRFYEGLNYAPIQGRWKVSHFKRIRS
jgi:GNAT superfamily N-acetyltransferase